MMANRPQPGRKVRFAHRPAKILQDGRRIDLDEKEALRLPPGQITTERFATLHHETKEELPWAEDIARWTLP
jgi:hypothetical protein